MKTISISLANENRVERNLYAQRWAAWNAKTKKIGDRNSVLYSLSNGQQKKRRLRTNYSRK